MFRKSLDTRMIALAMLLCAGGGQALADSNSAEIEVLRQQVRDLQARVEKLESGMQRAEAAAIVVGAVDPVPGGWRKEENWRLLTRGLPTTRVVEILGEPDDTRTIKKFEYWEYGDGLTRFYMGRLKSWDIPDAAGP